MGGREGLIDTAVKTAETGKNFIFIKISHYTLVIMSFTRLYSKAFDKSNGVCYGSL